MLTQQTVSLKTIFFGSSPSTMRRLAIKKDKYPNGSTRLCIYDEQGFQVKTLTFTCEGMPITESNEAFIDVNNLSDYHFTQLKKEGIIDFIAKDITKIGHTCFPLYRVLI